MDCVLTCGPCPDLPFSPFSHLVRLTQPTLLHLHPHTQGHNMTGYQEKRGWWCNSYSSCLKMQWTQNITGTKSTFITGWLTSLQKEKFLEWLTEMLKDIKNGIIMKGSLLISMALQSCRGRLPTLVTDITKGETTKMGRDYETDGHVEIGDYILLITEGKCELGELSADLHWQLMVYFQVYYAQKQCSNNIGESHLPAILIVHYGMFIPFARSHICLLTHFRAMCRHIQSHHASWWICTSGSTDTCTLTAISMMITNTTCSLDWFIQGLRNVFVGLKAYHKFPSSPISRYQSPKESVSINYWFPYKNLYTTEGSIEHIFEYKSWLTEGVLVFLVEGVHVEGKSNVIVIKFMWTYSKEVHELLAGEGSAPELYVVEDLCRWDISSVSSLPLYMSFGLQNIPLPLQVKNPTTGMLFWIRISETHFPHSLKTTT